MPMLLLLHPAPVRLCCLKQCLTIAMPSPGMAVLRSVVALLAEQTDPAHSLRSLPSILGSLGRMQTSGHAQYSSCSLHALMQRPAHLQAPALFTHAILSNAASQTHCRSLSTALTARQSLPDALTKRAAALILRPTSPHPPTLPTGPRTVLYPFPIEYYQDRESIVYNMRAEPKGVCTLPGDVYNVPVRVDILHRVVRWLRAMWQQGTHKAKTRAEVRGGGRKPWPQKGTGKARHGSIRSPIWVGGGVAHGPIPRSHAHKLPLGVQLLGYKCALSAKANEGRLVLVDSLIPEPVMVDGKQVVKTKATEQQLKSVLAHVPHVSALLIDCGEDALDGGEALRRGAKNLPWAAIMPWQKVTVYHLLKYQVVVMTHPAAMAMAARLQAPPTDNPVAVRKVAWLRQQRAAYEAALEQLQAAETLPQLQ